MRTSVEALVARDGDRVTVRSPGVGRWSNGPEVGRVVTPGCSLGQLEILGRRVDVVAGSALVGRVVEVTEGPRSSRVVPVGHGDVLLVLDPTVEGAAAAVVIDEVMVAGDAGLVFRSPSSGRFYSRPDPSKPAFVAVGDIVEPGQAVCMLEVMKTYSRVRFDGTDPVRVAAIVPDDGDDIAEGDIVLELEPSS